MGLFGETQQERMEKLSATVGGEFVPGHFLKSKKVVIPHDRWNIQLDYYTVSTGNVVIVYTRLFAAISPARPFKLKIVKEGFFMGIAKALGHEDLEINDSEFDNAFVIESDDEFLPKKILTPLVKNVLLNYPNGTLEIKKHLSGLDPKLLEDQVVLLFQHPVEIKDQNALLAMIEMMKSLLTALEECSYIR